MLGLSYHNMSYIRTLSLTFEVGQSFSLTFEATHRILMRQYLVQALDNRRGPLLPPQWAGPVEYTHSKRSPKKPCAKRSPAGGGGAWRRARGAA